MILVNSFAYFDAFRCVPSRFLETSVLSLYHPSICISSSIVEVQQHQMFWHLVDEPIEIPDKWATSPLVMSSIVKLLSFFCKLIIIFSWLSLVFFLFLSFITSSFTLGVMTQRVKEFFQLDEWLNAILCSMIKQWIINRLGFVR